MSWSNFYCDRRETSGSGSGSGEIGWLFRYIRKRTCESKDDEEEDKLTNTGTQTHHFARTDLFKEIAYIIIKNRASMDTRNTQTHKVVLSCASGETQTHTENQFIP